LALAKNKQQNGIIPYFKYLWIQLEAIQNRRPFKGRKPFKAGGNSKQRPLKRVGL